MRFLASDNLKLTDFMDLPTLQEVQDSFAAIASVKAVITDADGNLLTQPQPTSDFLKRQRAIEAAEASRPGPQREGAEYVAPIIVNNQRLGTIRMSSSTAAQLPDEAKLVAIAEKAGIDPKLVKTIAQQALRARNARPAAIQFLFLLANAIARLCFQEYQLRRRIDELTAVYNVTMLLADARDVSAVLQRTVEAVREMMNTKASSIRLIDLEKDELVIRAVHNLSDEYLNKGPVRFSQAQIEREALSDRGFCYVRNMADDPRVQFRREAAREGIVSMLSVGMRYKGKPVGVLRVYTSHEQHFSQLQIDLLKAIAAQAAAAIENARLLQETLDAAALERQVQVASEVQHRMVPRTPPSVPGLELASVYVPCYALGGDLFDFIPLAEGNLGLVVADVAGKGVPASLIMASVRAALRAHVDNIYYLYEVIRRLNVMLCRDTEPSEFVTLFYGVLDTRTRRFTYCNAGHPPALLLRNGAVTELAVGSLVLGVDPAEEYRQEILQLQPGDTLLLYTDGLTDAMNFERQIYGKQRLTEALARGGATADEIASHVLWDMRRFVGLSQRTDDVTMIVVKVRV
jgi:sigma-B regulation protein RsbU (phosphoserine phosphatase)